MQFTAVPGCATTWSSRPARWPSTSRPTPTKLARDRRPAAGRAAARGLRESGSDGPGRPVHDPGAARAGSPRSPRSCRCSRGTPTSSWTRSGPQVIPTVAQIRARFTERRKGAGAVDRVLRRLLGLEAKMRQYRDGAVFVRGVIEPGRGRRLQRRLDLARDPAAGPRDRGPGGLGAPRPRLTTAPEHLCELHTVARPTVRDRVPAESADGGERRWRSPMPRPRPSGSRARSLADLGPGDLVLVACSGGADSLALAAASPSRRRARALRAGAVVVDHELQAGSAGWRPTPPAQPAAPSAWTRSTVVRGRGRTGGGGLEAAARTARYAALEAAADRLGALAVLLGHTRDDQAEQVLLGLARGSGRPLPGRDAAPPRGRFRRPLLGVTREQTAGPGRGGGPAAWWDDPMNEDPAFTRVRARRAVADLERDLGPGVGRGPGPHGRPAARGRRPPRRAGRRGAWPSLGAQPWAVEALAAHRPVRSAPGSGGGCSSRPGRRPGRLSTRHTDACDALLTALARAGPGARSPATLLVRPIRWPGHHRTRRSG